MAYIVVSDVHLGSDSCNQPDFCEFLKWVNNLEFKDKQNKSEKIECNGKEITIHNPEKFILLGDILELWDPEAGNRDYVIRDCIKPYSILSQVNCEKIFVVGNHDDSLRELKDDANNVLLPNGTKFEIYDSHYPLKDKKTGIADGKTIGKRSFFFLHGHQFDKEQDILRKVSSLIRMSWDPLGWFQSLFNITFAKKHWILNLILFLLMLLGGRYVLEKLLIPNFLSQMNVGFFIIVIILLYFVGRYFWNYYLKPNILNNALWAALFLSGVYAGWLYFQNHQPSQFAYIVIWAAITGFFAISSIPGVVVHLQRGIYNLIKSRDKTTQEIITSGYYKKDNDTIEADVVVFGHTHFASYYELKSDKGKKLFINSGCWVGKDTEFDGKMRYANTFIYIDDDGGAYLLRWRCGKIECIESFPAGESVITAPAI